MKKIITLVCFLSIISRGLFAQYSTSSIIRLKDLVNMPAIASPAPGTIAEAGPDYGCLPITTRPIWMMISTCGTDWSSSFGFFISPTQNGSNITDTVGVIVWGPFEDTTNLVSQLNAGNIYSCNAYSNYIYGGGGFGFNIANFSVFPKSSTYIIMFTSTDSITSLESNTGGPIWAIMNDRCGVCHGKVTTLYQDLCIVAYDSVAQKNMPVWEKSDSTNLEGYNIYREGATLNQFDSVGNVSASQPGLCIDQQANPGQQAYKYKVSGRDSCGNTYLSSYGWSGWHRTIHLQTNAGILGEVNLAWNAYEGFTPVTYFIYRGSSQNNLTVLDSIASSNTAYTDFNPLPGLNFYRISFEKPGGCHPDSFSVIYSSRSNVAYSNVTAIQENESAKKVLLYPNPTTDQVNIDYSRVAEKIMSIRLFNALGEEVHSYNPVPYKRHNLMLQPAQAGVYTLELQTEKGVIQKKVVIK